MLIQEHVGDAIVMPIIKANAYGHGLIEVARHIVKHGATVSGLPFWRRPCCCVSRGSHIPILVLGGVLGDQVPIFIQHDLTLTASSTEKLATDRSGCRPDGQTGQSPSQDRYRHGAYWRPLLQRLHPCWKSSLKCKHTTIEGIFSHFANADAADLTSARLQLERFQEVLKFYEDRSLPTPIRHMANSGAILQLPESYLDMVRPGIILYGVYPSQEVQKNIPVSPALSWHTRVVYFKVVKPGHPVSYGSTWETDHLTRVVTIPVGYGDGYFRSMSNQAEVIIRGKRYPTIGRICMDQVMVNIEWEPPTTTMRLSSLVKMVESRSPAKTWLYGRGQFLMRS